MGRIALTTDAARTFLTWLDSGVLSLLQNLLEHPGYRAVMEHSESWGSPVSEKDVLDAVDGKPSNMYGMTDVRSNADRILRAADYVDGNGSRIVGLVDNSLSRIFAQDLIYPMGLHCIVGYDMGIGLGGKVALNLNTCLYLDNLCEIDFMLVHEATHVAYERAHGPMSMAWLDDRGGLRRLVCALVQNEGLAVYSPLQARIDGNCLENQDYRYLFDSAAVAEKTRRLKRLLSSLSDEDSNEEEVVKTLSALSKERLSYVVGCAAYMNLEKRGGVALVREAALCDPEEFIAQLTKEDGLLTM